MKLTLWQVEAMADWMRHHDNADDDTLATAHVDLTAKKINGDDVVQAITEAGERRVFWHDGSDATDDYTEEEFK